jgi:hypothetical protein
MKPVLFPFVTMFLTWCIYLDGAVLTNQGQLQWRFRVISAPRRIGPKLPKTFRPRTFRPFAKSASYLVHEHWNRILSVYHQQVLFC